MKFTVRILNGRSPELYMAVGHLVLNPACLRENYNYPYKTSRMFTWYLLYHEEKVVAFMPVERRIGGSCKIDNYYAASGRERGSQLMKLLKNVVREIGDEHPSLQATVQKRDVGIFAYFRFITLRETTRYAMMEIMHVSSGDEKQEAEGE